VAIALVPPLAVVGVAVQLADWVPTARRRRQPEDLADVLTGSLGSAGLDLRQNLQSQTAVEPEGWSGSQPGRDG
jgi:hypothetical protein